MKKMIHFLSFVFVMICASSSSIILSGDQPHNQKKAVQKKKNVQQKKGGLKTHRQMPAEKMPEQQKEAPIQDMETYVNEYDVASKQKTVATLLKRGVAFCKKNNLKTICHAFTHTLDFIEGSEYLFLLDTKGIVYAHGNQANLLWKNLWDKRDMFGTPIVQSMIKLAHAGGGSLTYEWDGAIKVSQIQRVDIEGTEFVIGCGYFPHSKEFAVIGLVKGAVASFNQYLKEKKPVVGAFSDMSYPKSPQFIFGDLYLYALGFDGTIYAQGERPGLIGSPALDYPDAKGKKYNAEIIEKLKNTPEGEGIWIEYTSKKALKKAYAEKVKDEKGNYYFIASGYYSEITRDTNVDLVRRGYQYMKSVGLSTATKAFDDELHPDYRYGDLGLFVYDLNGKCLANGRNPDEVGQNQWSKKDEDGRFYVQEVIEQAKAGGGWVNFKLNNSFEATYVEKIDLGVGEYVVGSGMYPVSKPETMRLLVKSAIGYLDGHTMADLLVRAVDRNDQFLRGDLFLYIVDLTGYCYAWGDTYHLIWKNLIGLQDEKGKPFVKLMIEAAQHGPDNLVLTMNKRPRVNYFESVAKDGKKYLIGSGFYK